MNNNCIMLFGMRVLFILLELNKLLEEYLRKKEGDKKDPTKKDGDGDKGKDKIHVGFDKDKKAQEEVDNPYEVKSEVSIFGHMKKTDGEKKENIFSKIFSFLTGKD
ncbi:MAG: hypothetical protein OQK82_02970, partial [Candidatus Pacearchaeota archaeon]|nr:hypothetical protein [Candidatus Pacearchaeota archaeon]